MKYPKSERYTTPGMIILQAVVVIMLLISVVGVFKVGFGYLSIFAVIGAGVGILYGVFSLMYYTKSHKKEPAVKWIISIASLIVGIILFFIV